MSETKQPARNVLGGPLLACSLEPRTGWFRDGCCNTNDADRGRHLVCCQVTAEFLDYSRRSGNDLSTPVPQHGFPGLLPGDQWCVCAERWKSAFEAGKAPLVVLEATHEKMLEHVTLEQLLAHAIGLQA